MKICITGSRDWTDEREIDRVLSSLRPSLIIHGAQRGADTLADKWGEKHGIKRLPFPAKWRKFGNFAGPLRNAAMLHMSEPDLVVAFPLPDSVGTWDTVRKARAANIPVLFHNDVLSFDTPDEVQS